MKAVPKTRISASLLAVTNEMRTKRFPRRTTNLTNPSSLGGSSAAAARLGSVGYDVTCFVQSDGISDRQITLQPEQVSYAINANVNAWACIL